MAIVQTDLGWECEEDYLVYDAGTFLTKSKDRNFYKSVTGYAFGFSLRRPNEENWCGPVLISTVRENVRYYYGSTTLNNNHTYKHFNRTWYINVQHHYRNADPFVAGELPEYTTYATGDAVWRELFAIAGVQLYRTDRVWAFLAGLSCGAAGKSLPKLEGT